MRVGLPARIQPYQIPFVLLPVASAREGDGRVSESEIGRGTRSVTKSKEREN
jgi:hypothetical protein